jgi:hypothetical protein
VRITYLTPTVSQRGVLTVRALVEPKTLSCKLALHGPRADVINVRAQRSLSGTLQWTYRVPNGTVAGSWTARVSCGSRAAARTFVVESPALDANVVVTRRGFTLSSYSTQSQSFISYGIVLDNKTSNVDALNVGVAVSFVDTLGRSVATDMTTLTGIPAGGTFYLGGFTSGDVSLTVASMEVSVTVGSTQSRRLTLPPVSGLGIGTDGLAYGAVSGTFENPYTKPIPSTGQIYVVYLNAHGSVIGGALEFTSASVQPGRSVAFSFTSLSTDIDDSFVPPSDVATIEGSVDPCGGPPLLPSCPAQVSTRGA